jgi:hypothetical protein
MKYLIYTYLDLGAAGKVAEEKGTTLAVPLFLTYMNLSHTIKPLLKLHSYAAMY